MCEYNQFGQALGVALPDWQPRPWPTRQVLQGSRCRLEPLTLAHASDLFAAHQLAPDPAAGRGCCVNLRATLQNSVPGWSRSPRWQTRFILPSLTSSEGKRSARWR